jgi:hypothetical protein
MSLLSRAGDDAVKLCREGAAVDLSSCSHRLPTIEVPPLTVRVQPSIVEVSPLTADRRGATAHRGATTSRQGAAADR